MPFKHKNTNDASCVYHMNHKCKFEWLNQTKYKKLKITISPDTANPHDDKSNSLFLKYHGDNDFNEIKNKPCRFQKRKRQDFPSSTNYIGLLSCFIGNLLLTHFLAFLRLW